MGKFYPIWRRISETELDRTTAARIYKSEVAYALSNGSKVIVLGSP